MPTNPLRRDPAGELRPVLALARMDCAVALSSQVDGLMERAARRPGRAVDPAWWAAALHGPAREFDDGWARRCGPTLRRAGAGRTLRHPCAGVAEITHTGSRVAGPLLAAAAADALPVPGARRTTDRARRPMTGSGVVAALSGSALSGPVAPGSVVSGALFSGVLLCGSLLSALAAAWRVLPAAGPGLILALSGLVLLAGAAVVARGRAVRAARAREIGLRVRAAVLAAADRELIRRSLDAERAAGVPAPAVTGGRATLRQAGAGHAA